MVVPNRALALTAAAAAFTLAAPVAEAHKVTLPQGEKAIKKALPKFYSALNPSNPQATCVYTTPGAGIHRHGAGKCNFSFTFVSRGNTQTCTGGARAGQTKPGGKWIVKGIRGSTCGRPQARVVLVAP